MSKEANLTYVCLYTEGKRIKYILLTLLDFHYLTTVVNPMYNKAVTKDTATRGTRT
jgi:hypothetical protein